MFDHLTIRQLQHLEFWAWCLMTASAIMLICGPVRPPRPMADIYKQVVELRSTLQ